MNRISTLEDIFGFFNGLKEKVTERAEQLQQILEEHNLIDEAREFTGAFYGFLSDVDHFLTVVNRVEGKAGDVLTELSEQPQESQEELTTTTPVTGAKKEGLVSGEDEHEQYLEKRLESREKIKPGDRITTLPPLERSESVGAPYDPEFLAEECIRLSSQSQTVGGVYKSVQEAFKELVAKDKNLSQKQIDDTRAILKSWGYTV